MRLRLQRHVSGPFSTIGAIFEVHPDTSLSDRWCWTCEDIIREVPNQPVSMWKIPGETAIPSGSYQLVFSYSMKFQRDLLEVLHVPGFSGIRLHPGNSSDDSEGCILPGMETDGTRVLHSRMAYNLIAARIGDVMEQEESVWLDVRNP